jgi:hypothetical protein
MFTVALLGVFALASVFVAVLGAQVYRSSAQKMESNFDTRTSLVYSAEKVRQNAGEDYSVRDMNGHGALVLEEQYDTEEGQKNYETWIYVADGKLYEALIQAGKTPGNGEGQSIMDMNEMAFSIEGALLTVTIKNDNGDTDSMTLSRRE